MVKERFERLKLTKIQKEEIKKYYNKYYKPTIEELTNGDYEEFKRTGKRIAFETKYFNRRRRINATFMMIKAFGNAYLSELINLLYSVCDEKTWALPAHTVNSESPKHEIDLFSAETGQMLTEISLLYDNILPVNLLNRIKNEVDQRLLNVFETRHFHWEEAKHNWSAVCAGCLGIIYIYRNKCIPIRILNAMDAYLSGINDDGVCLEGLGYWSYGFGYYMYFASLYKEYSGICLYDNEKVISLAEFQQMMYLGKETVSCSDSDPALKPLAGITGLICFEFDSIHSPIKDCIRNDDCGRWAHYIRSYLYPVIYSDNINLKNYKLYKDSQWYIEKKQSYSFFIKGGNNAEPHNHNDIASFIIASDKRQLLCDIGCGEYTSEYFNDQTRYQNLCCSSLGHSVPIINGLTQKNGKEFYCDNFDKNNKYIQVSFGHAYSECISATRNISLKENKISLYDKFDKKYNITERFITKIPPRIHNEYIFIDNLRIIKPNMITRKIISDHYGKSQEIFLLDYNINSTCFNINFEIIL